jgi:tRNA A37 threonylcarbamoyladenosine biosynthesis protein TsaE
MDENNYSFFRRVKHDKHGNALTPATVDSEDCKAVEALMKQVFESQPAIYDDFENIAMNIINKIIEGIGKGLNHDSRRMQNINKQAIALIRKHIIERTSDGSIYDAFADLMRSYTKKTVQATDIERAVKDSIEAHIEALTAKIFYNSMNYYNIPPIKKDAQDANVEVDDFITEVFRGNNGGVQKNKVSFLVGDVGVGKTAFINYLISVKFREFKDSAVFVRIDFENSDIENGMDKDQENNKDKVVKSFLLSLMNKFDRVVNDRYYERICKPQHDRSRSIDAYYNDFKRCNRESDLQNAIQTFSQLIHAMNKQGLRLILIVDNIDILCHNAKMQYLDRKKWTLEETLSQVVEHFLRNGSQYWASLSANILFVMREDTYHYFFDGSISNNDRYKYTQKYSMCMCEWEDIVTKRFNMVDFLINMLPNSSSDLKMQMKKHVEKVRGYLYNKRINLAYSIKCMTNSGLREMMDYLNRYSHISYLNEDRFLEQLPIAKMAFILHGKELYSDVKSTISNLFISTIGPNYEPVTYWCKYLLLKYVEARKDEQISIDNIYDVFSAYIAKNNNIVDDILKSLCQSNASNMLRLHKERIEKKIDVFSISITDKGSFLINEVIPKFYYFQLIVDDHALPIPRDDSNVIRKIFSLLNTEGYSYILYQQDRYSTVAASVITRKAEVVISFLTILKVALEYEKVQYSETFARLAQHHVQLPNIEVWIQDIKNELYAISNTRKDLSTVSIDNLLSEIDTTSVKIEQLLKGKWGI